MREIERGLDAFEHHGPAPGIERTQVLQATSDVLGSGLQWLPSELRRAHGEIDELERIAGPHQPQALLDGSLGLGERPA